MRISDWSSDVCSSDLAMFGRQDEPAASRAFDIGAGLSEPIGSVKIGGALARRGLLRDATDQKNRLVHDETSKGQGKLIAGTRRRRGGRRGRGQGFIDRRRDRLRTVLALRQAGDRKSVV